MSTDMDKTYLKTVLSKTILTQLKSDIGLLYEVIDLSDFLKTAVTLAGFQNHCIMTTFENLKIRLL
jgi:hypothetical protein